MKKQAIALILALMLLLTACDGTVPQETTAPETETTLPTETVPEETAPNVWVPREAPVVRLEVPEEEKREKEDEILAKGTFLYSGDTNQGYHTSNIDWLTGAQPEDSIVIRYTCTMENHAGWGVIGMSMVGPQRRKQIDMNAASTASREITVVYTVQELMNLVGCELPTDFKRFEIGAWNGGKILGLYHLPQVYAQELQDYWMQVAEMEQIIHTYTGALSNPNATENTKKLYAYLQEVYGSVCLTGQMESIWMTSPEYEMEYIFNASGKYPAIRGLDFMSNDFEGVAQRSLDWWERGGIVTICWHTGAGFDSGYTECLADNINWEEAFTPGSDTYNALIAGMDRAVPALQKLEEADVPVLWRPFHELDGGWFWWSKGGADNFVKLWQLMYSRYTDYWGLDNLIWVYGYSGNGNGMADWYPGDSYVDLLGADSYTAGANGRLYAECVSVAPQGMPIMFHECGMIPSQAEMEADQAPWLWFMVWHTEWLTDAQKGNTPALIEEIYNSDYFITLDELPDWN